MPIIKPFNCHCIQPGPGYSGDSYDNPYDHISNCANGRCNDSVFATIYEMDFDFTGGLSSGRACCSKYLQRYYNLYYKSPDILADVCRFETLEKMGVEELAVGVCSDHATSPLAVFTITNDPGALGNPLYAFNVTLYFHSENNGSAELNYGSNFDDNSINCLSTITLPIVSNGSEVANWNALVCVLGVAPLSITLTPV